MWELLCHTRNVKNTHGLRIQCHPKVILELNVNRKILCTTLKIVSLINIKEKTLDRQVL